VVARSFDCAARLFHTVFNRIVENCYEAFIIVPPLARMMA